MISIIGNSSKKIHQVICNWIGYHFYDAAPWNLTKSDGRLNSYLKDEEASKRKKSSDSTETMSYLCVCGLVYQPLGTIARTWHEMDAGWWAFLRTG